MRKLFILFILINLAINRDFAQGLKLEHYTIGHGLSQNSINCIYQDSKGYLWLGTDDGLDRYDGYSFSTFRSVREDKTTISDNTITAILEDYLGNLWVATFSGGLNKFDRKTETFKRYLTNKNDTHSIPENFIRGLYEDKQHTLWVYNQYICKYIPKTDNFERINLHLKFPKNTIHFLYEDSNDIYWIGTGKGLIKYNLGNGTYQCFRPRPNEHDSLSNSIISVTSDTGGIFWLGSNRGLYKFDTHTNTFLNNWKISDKLNKPGIHTDVRSIINDHQYLWMTWQSWDNETCGISRLNKNTNAMGIIFTKLSNTSDLLLENMYEDKSGVMWVGTFLNGLLKFEKDEKFQSLMKGYTIGAFLEDKNGVLWVGSAENGLYRFDRSKKIREHYRAKKGCKDCLSDDAVSCLFEDHKNTIWVGTMKGGLCRISSSQKNPEKIKFRHVLPGVIKSITEDLQHRLWIGLDGNFYLFNPDTKKTISFSNDPQNPYSISSTLTQVSLVDKLTGDIWIGTWDGLNRMILPKNGEITKNDVKFIPFKYDVNDIHSLGDSRVISLCMGKNGVLWAGTPGGFNKIEINRSGNPYQKTTYKITRYDVKNGLPNNVVYGILEDSTGNLWLSTDDGLSKFDPVTGTFVNFDSNDGLQSNQFFWRSYYKSPSGKMYFGGIDGYNSFYPENIKLNRYIPPVYLTAFSIFNKLQVPGAPGSPLKQNISETKTVTINYDQSVINFEYVALNYITPQRNKYAYKLEGFDKDWQYVGSQRKATYTNLDPGTYIFRVKASNNDGIWNEKGTSLTLIIMPPFWMTLWFRLIVAIFIIIIISSIYIVRESNIRNKNRLLKKLVEERTLEIREKNEALMKHAEALNSTNALLEERQQRIEEQSEEISAQRDQLSQLNSTKDKLFSILAHDLRNPFHAIIGFSELLLIDFKTLSEEKVQRFLGLIHSSSLRGNDLLENILQWSRTQTGRMTFEPEEQCLSIIAEEVKSLLEGGAQQKNITIHQLIDPDIIVIADENMVKTIFRNLISNAIKFTPEKGSITLSAEISINASYVEVSVSDTGIGIPETILKNLFRIDNTVSTKGTAQESGTGLGLLICKEFVEKHKGKIWVQSRENSGSTFYFTLPNKK